MTMVNLRFGLGTNHTKSLFYFFCEAKMVEGFLLTKLFFFCFGIFIFELK